MKTSHVTGPYTAVYDEDQGQIRPFAIHTCPVIVPYWVVKAGLVIRRYFPVSVNGASYGRRILSCLKMIEIKHYIDRFLTSSQFVLLSHISLDRHVYFSKNVHVLRYMTLTLRGKGKSPSESNGKIRKYDCEEGEVVRIRWDRDITDKLEDDIVITYRMFETNEKTDTMYPVALAYTSYSSMASYFEKKPIATFNKFLWFGRVELEKCYRLVCKSAEIVRHSLHISGKKRNSKTFNAIGVVFYIVDPIRVSMHLDL